MSFKIFTVAIQILAAFFLTGCLLTRTEVKEVEQRKVMQDQVSYLQKNTADSQVRFNDVYGELREVHGRVEALENRITLVNQEKNRLGTQQDQAHTDSNKKIAALQEEIIKLEGQVATLINEMNNLKAAMTTMMANAASAASAKPEDSEAARGDAFEIADEQFAKKEWKKSILNFQRYREANPKSKRKAEATFKIGVAFQELGMKDEAKTFLDEVLEKHPKSDYAKKAKTQLKKLK